MELIDMHFLYGGQRESLKKEHVLKQKKQKKFINKKKIFTPKSSVVR